MQEIEKLPSVWHARLHLRFTQEAGRTVVRDRRHQGPMRVLKALYPEGDAVAHVVLVHPPAGVAAGDAIDIECAVEPGAHAVISTPGAQKWYRAREHVTLRYCAAGMADDQSQTSDQLAHKSEATATTVLHVADDAFLEWLPQEAIIYDGCQGAQALHFVLSTRAKLLAWEMLMWGRAESGEQFNTGQFRQHIELTRAGTPMWTERTVVAGGDAALSSPTGFGGRVASGTMWIVGASDASACLGVIRAHCIASSDQNTCGASLLPNDFIVIKAVAYEIESLRTFFVRCREIVRPFLCVHPNASLRLWQT